MTEYTVVYHWTLVGFCNAVNRHLAAGWLLRGGVSTTTSPGGSTSYYQAMYKEKA